jgi:hypothetical protein
MPMLKAKYGDSGIAARVIFHHANMRGMLITSIMMACEPRISSRRAAEHWARV